MDLLIPDSGLLFWMTLVFVVVFLILWKWGFPVIVKMVNDRKAYIDESLHKAEEANDRLANIQKEGELLLQQAREKQSEILKEASATRDAIVEKAEGKARDESARIISDAKAEIQTEKQAAIRDIRNQVAELSVQIAEKILRQKLSGDKEQNELIDRLLDEVSSTDTDKNVK
jgi:F-type H+-transporting ATPase subunit b